MYKIHAIIVVLLMFFSCKNTSNDKSDDIPSSEPNIQTAQESSLIRGWKEDKFTVKKLVTQGDQVLYIMYKTDSEGKFFSKDFKSFLNVKVVNRDNEILLDTIIDAGNIYAEMMIDDKAVQQKNGKILLAYRICKDGNEGCEERVMDILDTN